MRIRSIKPDFWESEDIATLDWDARFVFIGLWSYVDDNGVGRDNEKLIRADLFPLEDDPRDTLARLSRALQHLSEAGRITRYTANGRRFLHITNWSKHQRIDRPNKARYPEPTSENTEIRETVASLSRDSREDSLLGAVEQRNRGTGEEEESSDPDGSDHVHPIPTYPKAFDEWWANYPRKDAKRKALEAWRRARKRATDEELTAGALRYATDPNREDRFTKQPATWLNGDCWLSDALPSTSKASGTAIDWDQV